MYYIAKENISCNNLIVDNLIQGKRRLGRAYTSTEVRSTDQSESQNESQNESQKENIRPTELSESDIQEELDNISQLNVQFNDADNESQTPDVNNVDARSAEDNEEGKYIKV